MNDPVIRAVVFWDVDVNSIDFHIHMDFIIRRIFERGTWDEVLEIVAYYGEKKVVQALTRAEYLMEIAIDVACLLFHLKPQEFKCYGQKQYHPNS